MGELGDTNDRELIADCCRIKRRFGDVEHGVDEPPPLLFVVEPSSIEDELMER